MIIIHHNTKIGGILLNPTVEHFGLFGPVSSVTPLKYLLTPILKGKKFTPTWDTIKAIKTKDDLQTTREADSYIRHFPNVVSLSPFLTKALISLTMPTATNVFLAMLEAAVKFYRTKEASVPSATYLLNVIIPYLWVAHHDHIGEVEVTSHFQRHHPTRSVPPQQQETHV